MSQLKIYRASAGSGKTFILTENFIKLLFSNPTDYRHILAVTFTNKATAEMRSRILESLYKLTDNSYGDSEYMNVLKKEFSISDNQVRERASMILYELLHDYSNFKVSTIDSFFQNIIRSFARETGLPAAFKLETKHEPLLIQAIDNVMLELERPENADLKKWLVEFAESRMEEDKYWNIASELLKICKLINQEVYQKNFSEIAQKLRDKVMLKEYKEQLQNIIYDIEDKLESMGKMAMTIIENKGLEINSDFFGGSRSAIKIFLRMKKFELFANEQKYLPFIDNPQKWPRKGTGQYTKSQVIDAYNSGLNDLLHHARSLVEQKRGDYFTAAAILKNLNALGIISDVNLKLNDICHEKNLFLLSNSNYLLNSIINNNETPFLYEKAGFRYSHFMIDEFQDTSILQYKNFQPLIDESLSHNNFSLFTGDVKQAIYRWRNSEWNILAEDTENDFNKFGSQIHVLDVNWRSRENIVTFNNNFFVKAADKLQMFFNEFVPETEKDNLWFKKSENKIKNVYSDVFQKVSTPKKDSGGFINIQFFEGSKKNNQEQILFETITHVASLIEAGYKKSDICILIRSNKEGVLMTKALLSGKYHPQNIEIDVFSSETLLLESSEAVKLLIAQLKFIQNPKDLLVESYIRFAFDKNNYKTDEGFDASFLSDTQDAEGWNNYKKNLFLSAHLPLFELVEYLVNIIPIPISDSDSIYVHSFLNVVHGFVNRENADLGYFLDFWEKNRDTLSISISENPDSVKVMTIHKAKGLEFKNVVMPFFDWGVKDKTGDRNFIWVEPKTEPFNFLNLVPVVVKNDLRYSQFSQDYFLEILSQLVDNLNLVYVAFTRAKESLSIFANISKTESNKITSVADLLFTTLAEENLLVSTDNEKYIYQKGAISVSDDAISKSRKHEETNISLQYGKLFPMRDRLEFHLGSFDYFDDAKSADNIIHGKIMHRIFEEIITINDIDKSLNKLKQKGVISSSEIPDLKQFILDKIDEMSVNNWFDGSYKVKTEANIIDKSDKRPDRVMFGDNEVIVVDYKFGSVKISEHKKQVADYIKLLSLMGYQNIIGYVWYVALGELEKIEDDKIFGIIGFPLVHSLSSDFFNKKFKTQNINAQYYNFPLNNINEIEQLIECYPTLRGFNVTMPFKEQIISKLDDISGAAKTVGAVNVVKIERLNGKIQLKGYNTDVVGFVNSLFPYLKSYHKKALILGRGGAAKSVEYALKMLNIEYSFVSRFQSNNNLVYNSLTPHTIKEHKLIINTTPLGMFPDINQCPLIPYTELTKEHLVYDLIYNPEMTMFLKLAKEHGATIINGKEMLILQAEESWKIWN